MKHVNPSKGEGFHFTTILDYSEFQANAAHYINLIDRKEKFNILLKTDSGHTSIMAFRMVEDTSPYCVHIVSLTEKDPEEGGTFMYTKDSLWAWIPKLHVGNLQNKVLEIKEILFKESRSKFSPPFTCMDEYEIYELNTKGD